MRKVLYLMGILSDTDVQWMATHGKKKVVPAGEALITLGKEIDALYILIDGRLQVEIAGGIKVATLMSGEVIGEISFVDSRPPSASVVAELPSIVLAIDKVLLKQKLETDGQFGAHFYRAIALFLADRLRSTTGRLGYKGPKGDEKEEPAEDPDELDEDFMQAVSMANVRFDMLVRAVR